MRHFKSREDAGHPSFIDPAFVDALAGGSRKSRAHRKQQHKTQQLCRQVERTLAMALSGECRDDVLRELQIVDVIPAPSASHLVIRVHIPAHVPLADALARLERSGPRLRVLVAQAITRKRAPELSFIPAALAGEVIP